jgi:hypothetical protein
LRGNVDTVLTGFKPEQHGFKFVNRFDLSEFNSISLPFIRFSHIALGNVVYGLCGGMSFAAIDYFHAEKAVPTVDQVDDISLKLFLYLWNRQMTSLAQGTVIKVFQWMILDDNSLAKDMTNTEIPKLRGLLKVNFPVPLALVRVKALNDPTLNHQVTAIGYDFDENTKQMAIQLYDPNHPGEQPTLNMNLSNPNHGISLTQSTGEPLRGFFVIDYQQQTPP